MMDFIENTDDSGHEELIARSFDMVVTGTDLGLRAKHFAVKSTAAILEVAATVEKAMKLYYVAKEGRPGTLSESEAYNAKQWNLFLEASGFTWEKNAKLLGKYSAIGKCPALTLLLHTSWPIFAEFLTSSKKVLDTRAPIA